MSMIFIFIWDLLSSYDLDKYYCSLIGDGSLLDSNALDITHLYKSYV